MKTTTHLTLAVVLRPIFRELENDDRIICIPDYGCHIRPLFQHIPICWRAHNSSPHKWYCHIWDWHNWYLTLLINLKLILVKIGTLNYWYWAKFTLTLLKFEISDLQNDWHLQLLIFGIIGISCFWFLESFIFSMSDIKHDWYRTWLTLVYLILWISGIEHYQKFGEAAIIYYWFMMP